MRTYTLKEVSKIIQISVSTIKQWEKDLIGLLEIPRSKQGARLYTKSEIDLLMEIKQLYQNNVTGEELRNILLKKMEPDTEPVITETEIIEQASAEEEPFSSNHNEIAARSTENFFAALDQYKQTFLEEVKNEIIKAVSAEITEVKKEISKGTLNVVKNISDSIYKSSANTIEDMKELSYNIQKNAQAANESFKDLEKTLADQSYETSEEFYTIAKQLAETSEELAHYIDVTNNEITCLSEALERDREYFIQEQEQFRQEIRTRELAFQSMLSSYRDAAPSRGRKWWKFW